MPSQPDSLRIAWLVYRGNPHCGGQGVYTRYLAKELTELGHQITVFSGQPYPELDDPSQLAAGPQPRPLPSGEPVPGAVAVGVQDHDRPPGVRHHVRGGVPRAVHVQPAGAPTARAAPRRLRPHPRQPVPRLRPARDDGRRLARAGHAAPPDHRRPRPRPRARDQRLATIHPAPLVRVPRDADEGRRRDPAPRHRVGVEQARHRRADGRACRPAAHRARGCRPVDVPPDARRSRACPVAS